MMLLKYLSQKAMALAIDVGEGLNLDGACSTIVLLGCPRAPPAPVAASVHAY
jgi:hypothetical protein